MPRGVRWPERDEAALREWYPLHGSRWPGWETRLSQPYSQGAISQHAAKMGLRAPRGWSPEEDRELVLAAASLCRRLRRTPLAVAHRLEHLVAKSRGRLREKMEGVWKISGREV